MKRASISISDVVADAIEAHRHDQELPPSLTAVAEAALAEYLSQRGYLYPALLEAYTLIFRRLGIPIALS